jgi:radical SAM superfamily enzyme YgiQ (UPF0313 family)
VAAELASRRGKVVIFWDDNLVADMDYAKALCRAIAPARKWWASQAGVAAGQDDEFLDLAARAGCKQLFIGLESVSQASLNATHKAFSRVTEFKDIIARCNAHGIAVQAGIVFGFDQDGPGVFDETIDFLEDAGCQNATFNILTPYPGTPLFRRLEAEGRILTHDWARYTSRDAVVFRPLGMTPEELQAGFHHANDRFYSLRSVARRLRRAPTGLWWNLPNNLAYWWARRLTGRAMRDHDASRDNVESQTTHGG